MFQVTRDPKNPVISPDPNVPWQAEATFNPSPVSYNGTTSLVFRAATHPSFFQNQTVELSTIAVADEAADGTFGNFRELITPTEAWERYGCEDPRVTKIGDTFYIFYTALGGFPFGPDNIKVAVALTKDLKTIDEKHLVTPFNAKAMALFPERVSGKLRAILTVNSDLPPSKIAIAEFNRPEDMWSPYFWDRWYRDVDKHSLNLKRSDSDHVEVGAPPIWTKDGWLLIYSHIQNYFTEDKCFGIEAVLLDLEHPTEVLSRTIYPFMVPEEGYERYGRLPKIIFPSGAQRHGDRFTIYYGSTDTTCCRATLRFSALLDSLSSDGTPKQHVSRSPDNPILKPIPSHPWEALHVLNPTAIDLGNRIRILYRAVGHENTSVIGLAETKDGVHIDDRQVRPVYTPRADFELKHGGPTDNSGCEDARIIQMGDKLFITYTAYDSIVAPKVAESSISVADFEARRFENWTMPRLVSPDGVDDKDACIFPERISHRYMLLHRIANHICADYVSSLAFRDEKLTRCIQVIGPRPGMWDSEKVGIASPPIKTPDGWLLFYHGITASHEYCLGAALLDLKNPTVVLGRSSQPVMTPVEPWEKEGWISNVVFPCGIIARGDTLFIYYGGADQVVAVATAKLSDMVQSLKPLAPHTS